MVPYGTITCVDLLTSCQAVGGCEAEIGIEAKKNHQSLVVTAVLVTTAALKHINFSCRNALYLHIPAGVPRDYCAGY